MTRVFFGLAMAGAAAALAACSTGNLIGPSTAAATLAAKSGTQTGGTVTFTQQGDMVMVKAVVTGLAPGSEHGFHVHEKGDCSAPDAMSAGGHFNPEGRPHGSTASQDHHAGDIPNLKADANGTARAEFMLHGMSVGTGKDGVIGRAVVVHKDPDDYKSQPAGNSGARIACGVIAAS